MSRDDTMFDRWSRRKRAVAEAEADRPEETPPATAEQVADGAQADPLDESELLEKLGLPDPDTMMKGDDFAAFMRAGVPDFLRKRALRRLWLSNPVLANLDGLLDHGEDFTDAATVPKVMNTLYQVGKGMLRQKVDPVTPEETAETQDALASVEIEREPTETFSEVGAEDNQALNDMKIEEQHTDNKEENENYKPRRMSFSSV